MGGTPVIAETVDALRSEIRGYRTAGEKVALVPTMGALHAGHVALVERAKELADRVVVSIFVNPTQFAPNEDFSRYPRTFAADCALLAAHDVDVVYAPAPSEMYPPGFATEIVMSGPARELETQFRPHFFSGVAIVVSKLLLQCLPEYALFGEKDYQQLKVVTRMARDLDLQVEIVPVATLREADGLALSSRNRYLSMDERAVAPVIHRTLQHAASALRAGGGLEEALTQARTEITAAGMKLDYLEARHAETLAPVVEGDPIRLLVAAWLGTTRLIDNIGV
ncbi:MAG: pantoate--beta-alanine ligase [Rhizobiales bacterium 32-66-8]|nr:MAG: pantoate--beta-alanine ligase [Rhizobiales bacterium 32-66-8]